MSCPLCSIYPATLSGHHYPSGSPEARLLEMVQKTKETMHHVFHKSPTCGNGYKEPCNLPVAKLKLSNPKLLELLEDRCDSFGPMLVAAALEHADFYPRLEATRITDMTRSLFINLIMDAQDVFNGIIKEIAEKVDLSASCLVDRDIYFLIDAVVTPYLRPEMQKDLLTSRDPITFFLRMLTDANELRYTGLDSCEEDIEIGGD